MADLPKGKAKTKPVIAKRPATLVSKTPASRGKPKPAIADKKYLVSGTVLYADSTPATSLTVIAYDKDVSSKDSLGQSVVTSESGTFAISYSEADFRRTDKERDGADVVVCVYADQNGKHELLFTSKTKNNAPPEYEVNIMLPVEQFVVRGTVVDATRKPLAKMLVQAYERDLRVPQLLGTAETDASGDYGVNYRPKDFQLADTPPHRTPWLIVEVRATAGGTVLARQEVQRAARDQTISFTLASVGAISEWQRISDAVGPLLMGQGTTSLGPNSHVAVTERKPDLLPFELNASDIDFIVLEVQFDRVAVEAWVSASRMLHEALEHMPAEFGAQQLVLRSDGWPFFYSFARQNLARDLDAVLRESAAKWQQVWLAACAANQVTVLDEKQLQLMVDALVLLQRLQQLDPAYSGNSDFARILTNSPLPIAVALDALAVYRDKGLTDVDALLALVKLHPEADAPIKAFVRGVRVHQLVAGHEGLSRVLSARLKDGSDSIEPLAALPSTEWLGMAGEAAISQGYALRVQAHVEKQHPVTALKARLDGGQLEMLGASAKEIGVFIKRDSVLADSILRGKTSIKKRIDKNAPEIHKVLSNLGLFTRAGLSLEMAGHLMGAGIKSPGTAVRYGREHIRNQYLHTLPEGAADEAVAGFFESVEPVLNGANGFMIDVAGSRAYPAWMFEDYKTPLPDSVRENLPTLPGLFGDLDECICKPCESMLGQPAYLVDLLNLLHKESGAYELLESRRPDILELKLSCENADKEVQHIGIVLEILENAAGADPYLKTANAIYPWRLPFSLAYAATTTYLSKLEVSRFDLLSLRGNSEANALAAETLNLTCVQTDATQGQVSEWQLLTEKRTGASLWAAYGFNIDDDIAIVDPASGEKLFNQTVQDVLKRVSVLIDRTALSLDELQKALKTEFVAGFDGEYRFRLSHLEQCKTSQMRVIAEDAAFEDALDRLHRFVRLQAKLPGWSIAQLDQAIAVCGGMETRQSVAVTPQDRARLLVNLAIVKRLHDDHGVPLDCLLEREISETKLRKSLGLSSWQFSLLSRTTALDLAAPTSIDPITQKFRILDWMALENFCNEAKCMREGNFSFEQLATAQLPRTELTAIGLAHAPSVKSSEQINLLLAFVRSRLRSIAIREDVTLEAQALEAMTAIFDTAVAGRVIQAIRGAGAVVAADRSEHLELLPILHGDVVARSSRKLGEWAPLLDETEAITILSMNTGLTVDARLERLLAAIAARRRERELISVLANQSGLAEAELVTLLSFRLLTSSVGFSEVASAVFLNPTFWSVDPAPADLMAKLQLWMERLYRLVDVRKSLDLDNELMNLADQVAVGGVSGIKWRDMLATTSLASAANWQALMNLLWLEQPERLSRQTLHDLVDKLVARGSQAVQASDLQPVAIRLGTTQENALSIANQVSSTMPLTADKLRDPSQLRRVFELLLLARQLGANATQLDQLANVNGNVQAASTAKTLLQEKFAKKAWPETFRKIEDPLLQQRRDALVAYLVWKDNNDKLRTANDLYEHYFIDPQMEPCFDTTRILEAVTAAQLLTQRILFGLEAGISASDNLKQRWTWMRNYRIWEANRKVFLFPENWLYPELRDDKSSSFKQLESALGQGELTQGLAVQSFGQFLDDVAKMGQIEVLGMYEDIARDSNGDIQFDEYKFPLRRTLYVIGRTPNPPYSYFWRSCEGFGSQYMEWSPWQRIELDIQGDHVLPFVLGGQLHVAWPVIRRIKENSSDDSWEVKLAWSRHDGKSWKKSSISRDFWNDKVSAFSDERRGFAFRCETALDGSAAEISVYALGGETGAVTTIDTAPAHAPTPSAWDSSAYPVATGNSDGAFHFLATLIKENYGDVPAVIKTQLEIYATRRLNLGPPVQAWQGDMVFLLDRGSAPHDKRILFSDPEAAAAWYSRHGFPNSDTLPAPVLDAVTFFLWEFWDDATRTLTNPTASNFEDFRKFLETLQRHSSRRKVICKAWIKLTAPDSTNTVSYLPLTGNQSGFEGVYTCAIGSEVIDFIPGVLKPMGWKLGAQAGVDCKLTLTLDKITPTGATQRISLVSPAISLASIQPGYEATQTVHFVIDGTSNSGVPIKAIDIGFDLDAMKKLKLVSAFKLTSGDIISTLSRASQNEMYNPIQDSLPWMNGFRERSTAQGVLPLQIANYSNALTPVFLPTKPSPFWIIGSATAREAESDQRPLDIPAAWHYSENGFDCYIDIGPGNRAATDGGLLVYADSYPEATLRRSEWSQYQTLTSQHSTFGAEELPVPGIGTAAIWTDAKDGKLTFDSRLPYACYNWEVFFHAPLLIADQLSKQHKFEDAERWLRYVFDPTSGGPETDPTRFLKFRPFKEPPLKKQVIDDLTALAQVAGGFGTARDDDAVQQLIGRWRDAPFRPFLIARRRHVAFLWRTLFAYLDNLLAWADSLYRRDTRESINEATMLYVLAERILGRRPQLHEGNSNRPAFSYKEKIEDWDDFANYWIDVGSQGASNLPTGYRPVDSTRQPSPEGVLYFCMPFNDKISSYWGVVESRLSNVRNCRNIDGIKRTLPLMDAPIDPELLTRATAAGLDLSDVISGLYAPPPHYRYNILSARAAELGNETKALGAAMLSAIEKRDAEHLAQLRSSSEIGLLRLVQEVRSLQISEAESNIDALRASRRSVSTRYSQYQRLLGKKDIKVPEERETVGEESMLGRVEDGSSGLSNLGLIDAENQQIEHLDIAHSWTVAGGVTKGVAGGVHAGASIAHAYGAAGDAPGKVLTAVATGLSTVGDMFELVSRGWQHGANRQSILGSHLRRRDEWAFQSNQTLKELQQIDKQILANQIRIDITKKELSNHGEQMEQAKAIDEVMRTKFSNEQLYEWMRTQLYGLYSSAYRMALEMARRAERAAARELGVKPLNILRNDHWDSLRDGLLAGERLHQDIKRLEVTYLDQNRREFELTKHVSLRRLNPNALVNLRVTRTEGAHKHNSCEFDVPEWLFDLDTPGHYLRRIKSVSVSIPGVIGPYTSVNCKLTLLSSHVRHESSTTPQYARVPSADDPRFTDSYGASEAIVTSTGNVDSGLFETQLRDERFLPFEGSGVISTWRLELPGEYPQFDYSTISDVVLTIRYTARDGGDSLRNNATAAIKADLANTAATPSGPLRFNVLLSGRYDFPSEWASSASGNTDLTIPIKREFMPYWMDVAGMGIQSVTYVDVSKSSAGPVQFSSPSPVFAAGDASVALGPVAAGHTDKLILLEAGR